jgi:uroporphyrinogen decarboxylase
MTGRFRRALAGEALATPPIWMMRQAGRYHSHYQRLRRQHSFDELCRTPALAADVAMGPIEDFDFDAAIVFSDLLYPLDALGLTVSYDDGPPTFSRLLTAETIDTLAPIDEAL